MLVLDAALTGAKGLNLWSSFRGAPPQRRARLYTALVERGWRRSSAGALLPTREPFLYSVSLTATEGVPLADLEEAATREIERVRDGRADRGRSGAREAAAAGPARLRGRQRHEHRAPARLLRDRHRAGLLRRRSPSRVLAVTAAQVAGRRARAASAREQRTVGWFRPLEHKA